MKHAAAVTIQWAAFAVVAPALFVAGCFFALWIGDELRHVGAAYHYAGLAEAWGAVRPWTLLALLAGLVVPWGGALAWFDKLPKAAWLNYTGREFWQAVTNRQRRAAKAAGGPITH